MVPTKKLSVETSLRTPTWSMTKDAGCSQSDVCKVLRKFKQNGKVIKGKHTCRPRKTLKHQDRKLKAICLENWKCIYEHTFKCTGVHRNFGHFLEIGLVMTRYFFRMIMHFGTKHKVFEPFLRKGISNQSNGQQTISEPQSDLKWWKCNKLVHYNAPSYRSLNRSSRKSEPAWCRI